MLNKEESLDFEISEESKEKLNEMFKPLREAYSRFENGKETLDDLLKYYPNFKMQIDHNGKKEELDLVKKKYYEKLVDIVNKQSKIIDEMAEQLAGLTIWNNEKEEPIILGDKEEVKQYFEKKVEEK